MKNFGRAAQYPLPLGTKSPVAYFVLSRRGSFEVRKTIRNTWAFGKDNVFFVIGEACTIPLKYRSIDDGGNLACGVSPVQINKRYYFEEVQKNILIERAEDEKLLLEQAAFQDILFVNEIDTYRSLSKKLKFIYTHAYQNLPTAKWIVKIDDDFFVRVDDFHEYIMTNFNESVPTVISGLIGTGKAHTAGKWKEVPQYPPGKEYPPFPLGSFGHAVSLPVFQHIAEHQGGLFDYQGEDTSLGIWLSQSKAIAVEFHQTNTMKNNGVCKDRSVFIVGHDITPREMIECNKTLN